MLPPHYHQACRAVCHTLCWCCCCWLTVQAWPKRCGHMQGKSVIPCEEHAAKIRAAVDARGQDNEEFIVVARTDARATHGLDEAIRRGACPAPARHHLFAARGGSSLTGSFYCCTTGVHGRRQGVQGRWC